MKTALSFLLFVALAVGWQWRDGAYRSEFGGHPDEAAHCVTGLMMRDFLAQGGRGGPMAYAEAYYAHYPKIGLGVWPPVFYLVQAGWTLPPGASRASLLALIAVLAAGVALLLYRELRAQNRWLAPGAAVAFLSLPLARELYGMVMAETLSALLLFAATLAFGHFLERERARDALLFGLFAALGILTKGTGLALIFMAPAAVALSGRWALLRRPALWGGVLVVALLAGPWTWHFREAGRGGWLEPHPSWHFTREAIPYYFRKLALAAAPPLILLALSLEPLRRRAPAARGTLLACAALVLSVIVFQSLAPVGLEARHLVPVLPAVLLLAARGAACLPWPPPLLAAVLALSCAALPQLHPKDSRGFSPVAEQLATGLRPGEEALVSSDASGEGMLISELALRDRHRPSWTVQRASKALAASEWSGREYRTRFADEAALKAWILASHVRFLILDDSVPPAKRAAHQAQLQALTEHAPESFSLVAEFPIERPGSPGMARLYRVQPPAKE